MYLWIISGVVNLFSFARKVLCATIPCTDLAGGLAIDVHVGYGMHLSRWQKWPSLKSCWIRWLIDSVCIHVCSLYELDIKTPLTYQLQDIIGVCTTLRLQMFMLAHDPFVIHTPQELTVCLEQDARQQLHVLYTKSISGDWSYTLHAFMVHVRTYTKAS